MSVGGIAGPNAFCPMSVSQTSAIVTLKMVPKDGGTLVKMTENPDGLVALVAFNPLVQLFVHGRNLESLARLEELALRRATPKRGRNRAPGRRAQAPSSA